MRNIINLTKCVPGGLFEVPYNWMSDMSRTKNFTKGNHSELYGVLHNEKSDLSRTNNFTKGSLK